MRREGKGVCEENQAMCVCCEYVPDSALSEVSVSSFSKQPCLLKISKTTTLAV